MGKRLIQQARGKGGPTYRSPSFRYKGKPSYLPVKENLNGEVIDIIKCPGHSAPLTVLKYDNNLMNLMIAPEGIRVGDFIEYGDKAKIKNGNVLMLKDIPEGTFIYNIEKQPGDGGKFVRSSGTFARVTSKVGENIMVQLPSKKKKPFNAKCRATVGVIAGSGRKEKPFVKAGIKFYNRKAKNKLWPSVSGTSQNAVDHPFGGTSSAHKGKPTIAPRNAPPGRKVGAIRPRRMGRKKK
jgi:large subunit ribosomal protein L2